MWIFYIIDGDDIEMLHDDDDNLPVDHLNYLLIFKSFIFSNIYFFL